MVIAACFRSRLFYTDLRMPKIITAPKNMILREDMIFLLDENLLADMEHQVDLPWFRHIAIEP